MLIFFATDKNSNLLSLDYYNYYISNGSNYATIVNLAAVLIAAALEEINVVVERKVYAER